MTSHIEFEPLLEVSVEDGSGLVWVAHRDDLIRHLRRLNWEYLDHCEWRESEGENEDYSHLCAACPAMYNHEDLVDEDGDEIPELREIPCFSWQDKYQVWNGLDNTLSTEPGGKL